MNLKSKDVFKELILQKLYEHTLQIEISSFISNDLSMYTVVNV
jgi:hypothetical protein